MTYIPSTTSHKSVLMKEVLEHLKPQQGDIIIDATFGAGGYTRNILSHAECTVYGIDRDPDVIKFVDIISAEFGDRFKFSCQKFSQIKQYLIDNNLPKVNAIVLDLGVSSMQLDTAERGFSFMHNADLDMRMDKNGLSAKEIVNSYKEEDLANIIYQYGEERNSRRIAKAIVTFRRKEKIETTNQLRSIIHSVSKKSGKIDSATKTFQALRIFINKELVEIETLMNDLQDILAIDARLVVVSFHALEDRIIKFFLRNNKQIFHTVTKKVVQPLYEETKLNPRSRSSRLRSAVFLGKQNEEI
jgi:16S rRNA (cytosine1402-N4)-methyltransferase